MSWILAIYPPTWGSGNHGTRFARSPATSSLGAREHPIHVRGRRAPGRRRSARPAGGGARNPALRLPSPDHRGAAGCRQPGLRRSQTQVCTESRRTQLRLLKWLADRALGSTSSRREIARTAAGGVTAIVSLRRSRKTRAELEAGVEAGLEDQRRGGDEARVLAGSPKVRAGPGAISRGSTDVTPRHHRTSLQAPARTSSVSSPHTIDLPGGGFPRELVGLKQLGSQIQTLLLRPGTRSARRGAEGARGRARSRWATTEAVRDSPTRRRGARSAHTRGADSRGREFGAELLSELGRYLWVPG